MGERRRCGRADRCTAAVRRPARLGRRWPAIAIGLALVAAGCERSAPLPPKVGLLPEGGKKPNVIFVLIDTLRADRLGAYGHARNLTPAMDSIAAEGLVFDRAVAPAPWTLPSIASLFTSYYPSVHKAYRYVQVQAMVDKKTPAQSVLDERFETLAEVMKAGGYGTAGVVANKFMLAEYGFAQGFDHYDTSMSGENTVPGERVNAAAFAWLAQRDSDKPLFLYVHYMDVHGPYDAAPQFMEPLLDAVEQMPIAKRTPLTPQQLQAMNPYLRKPPKQERDPARYERLKDYREYWAARYEAGVAQVDYHLGQLRDGLRQLGLWDDAYVIVTADHGEALGEHSFPSAAGPRMLWEHGYSLYQTDLHIPLILRWPRVLPAGKRVAAGASLMDMLPTLAEQLRLRPPAGVQGESLVDAWSGRVGKEPRRLYAEAVKTWPDTADSRPLTRHEAGFRGDWKLIKIAQSAWRGQPGGAQWTLFNVARDPGELQPVNDEKVLADLRDFLRAQNDQNTQAGKSIEGRLRPAHDLGNLGYVAPSADDQESDESDAKEESRSPASQPAAAASGGDPKKGP